MSEKLLRDVVKTAAEEVEEMSVQTSPAFLFVSMLACSIPAMVLSPFDDCKGCLSFEPRWPVTNRAGILKKAHIAERGENRIVENGGAFEATHAN